MQAGARGVKIIVSGRLGGAEMKRSETQLMGSIPLHTLDADVDYGFTPSFTTYGTIGVKVWIHRGMFSEETPGEEEDQSSRIGAARPRRRGRTDGPGGPGGQAGEAPRRAPRARTPGAAGTTRRRTRRRQETGQTGGGAESRAQAAPAEPAADAQPPAVEPPQGPAGQTPGEMTAEQNDQPQS